MTGSSSRLKIPLGHRGEKRPQASARGSLPFAAAAGCVWSPLAVGHQSSEEPRPPRLETRIRLGRSPTQTPLCSQRIGGLKPLGLQRLLEPCWGPGLGWGQADTPGCSHPSAWPFWPYQSHHSHCVSTFMLWGALGPQIHFNFQCREWSSS